jgi:type III pantothenate kinase
MSLSSKTLLIDAGNTRIKFAVMGDAPNDFQVIGACDAGASDFEIAQWLEAHAVTGNQAASQARGVCVAGDTVLGRIQAALSHINIPSHSVTWLNGTSPLRGLRNDYTTPLTLGPDRLLAAYGAIQGGKQFKQSYVIATFGTATTVDCVYWDAPAQCHVFAGGIIIAGLEAAWRSVSRSTAKLPDVSAALDHQSSLAAIPNSTKSALQLGALYAQAGAVQHFSAIATQRFGSVELLVAGGAAHLITPYLGDVTRLDSPVLLGLAYC